MRELREDQKAGPRKHFMEKNPDAFWVDFGDFRWFVMDNIVSIRYNGGFGAARTVGFAGYPRLFALCSRSAVQQYSHAAVQSCSSTKGHCV